MILTVDEFRQHYQTEETDEMLKSKLTALELLIRAYTCNNFQDRSMRQEMGITDGVFTGTETIPFRAGDTVQLTNSEWNNGLYTIRAMDSLSFSVNEDTRGTDYGTVTKVTYPADVKMGVINLMKWDLERRDKVGIQSETLSRHTVNYADMNNGNTLVGYPKMLISFLFPYKRARFGDGAAR